MQDKDEDNEGAQQEYKEWYNSRPKVIQELVDRIPPTNLYRFKDSKKECYIYSYSEDGTVTVQKTGVGGPLAAMGLSSLDRNQVFGVSPDDLEIVKTD